MKSSPIAAGRYELQEKLGEGQMSVVWLARDVYSKKLVAFKIMTAITEDDRRNRKAYDRFVREIEIASSLNHPGILPIIDYGDILYNGRDVPFLVSSFVDGGSLADLISESPPWEEWSFAQIADAVMQAADSLYYLHTHNPQIVHQDVKPGNFLVTMEQHPARIAHFYLCDFGISRWLRSSGSMASELLGTFAYMAPEQIDRKLHCASDQYALAVMACYMLTGKLPLQASTNEMYIRAHRRERPIPPTRLNPECGYSSEVDAIILRALEKNPAKRFPNILMFGQALQQALMKGDDSMLVTMAAPSETASQDRQISLSQVQLEDLAPISLDPWDTEDGHVLDEPLPARPAKPVRATSQRADGTLPPLALRGPISIDLPARPKFLSWSPNGQVLATTLYGARPQLWRQDGARQEVATATASAASSLCWSPDARVLAISAQGEIRFWDTGTQAELPLVLSLASRELEALDWSSNGQLAVWVDQQIQVYSLSPAKLTSRQAPVPQLLSVGALRPGNAGVLRWSPDGELLVAGASNGTILCWYVPLTASPWQVTPPGQKVMNLAWSPDNELLVAAFRDSRVVGWDVAARTQTFLWQKLPTMPRTLSVSLEQHIAIASGEKHLLCGFPSDVQPANSVAGQLLVSWSPESLMLATLSEQKDTALAIWHG